MYKSATMSEENIDLGHKRTCPHCSVKYYDFYQDELDCPECGKTIEAVNIMTVSYTHLTLPTNSRV